MITNQQQAFGLVIHCCFDFNHSFNRTFLFSFLLKCTVCTVQESRGRAQEALRADEGRWLEEERKLMERRVKHQVQVPSSHTHYGTPLLLIYHGNPPGASPMGTPIHTLHCTRLSHPPCYLSRHHKLCLSLHSDLLADNEKLCSKTLRPF